MRSRTLIVILALFAIAGCKSGSRSAFYPVSAEEAWSRVCAAADGSLGTNCYTADNDKHVLTTYRYYDPPYRWRSTTIHLDDSGLPSRDCDELPPGCLNGRRSRRDDDHSRFNRCEDYGEYLKVQVTCEACEGGTRVTFRLVSEQATSLRLGETGSVGDLTEFELNARESLCKPAKQPAAKSDTR
jgi:hypothetical protein